MHFRLNQNNKLENHQVHSDISRMRGELEDSIKYEEHRKNVDTAKKTAVKQLMDYNNFHQMVLGADLKPIQTKEMKELVNAEGYRPEKVYNIYGRLEDDEDTKRNRMILGAQEKAQKQLNEQNMLETEIKPENDGFQFFQATNFQEYKKLFEAALGRKPCKETEIRLLEALQGQNRECYKKIFGIDFEVEYLVRVVDIMLDWLQDSSMFKEQRSKVVWFLEFLLELVKLRKFKMAIKEMLGSSDRITIKKFLDKFKEKTDIEGEENPYDSYIEDLRKAYLKK